MSSTSENPFESTLRTSSPEPILTEEQELQNITSKGKGKEGRVFDRLPTPAPLGLPPPTIGVVTRPPENTQQMSQDKSRVDNDENEDDVNPPFNGRWWTDWLCGCREGADRGGDHQAGSTNPME
ncbi:uncharacterized protein EI90DRAFT_3019192 [Cantharellus anzutake]|uniref:uncharacterized protein n=1 Tax=Cantharellus anzutake TaxID=1750568 RepID=UPI001903A9E5|nr:uncharacterized protein EI90DRAFT_3019192 [Cantharellus anzutake]KAF8325225.1 hypothetical protein EI90DRAFT_3019192 [Cantharellus anzutake]